MESLQNECVMGRESIRSCAATADFRLNLLTDINSTFKATLILVYVGPALHDSRTELFDVLKIAYRTKHLYIT